MIVFNRRFQPSLLMLTITLLAVGLFIALGLWQLDRAAYKQIIVDRYEARLAADYVPFRMDNEQQYRRVILEGRYDDARNLLLDNQLSQGRAGYHVLSPFELSDGNVILINRGWVPAGPSRQQLPEIESPRVADKIKGVIVSALTEGFRMGEVHLSEDWPQVIPYIDIAALQAGFDDRLLPVVLWLSVEQEGWYERDWRPVWLLPEKSRAYAVQWFSFAFIALLLFFILNFRKSHE